MFREKDLWIDSESSDIASQLPILHLSLFVSISAPANDLIRKLDCGRTLKRRNKRRILGEEEAGGGEKTARVGDVVASKAGDSRPLSDGKLYMFFAIKRDNLR